MLHPGVSEAHQRVVYFLLNLLLIEFRAELGFQLSETLLRDPELFPGRRAEAEHAAEIVGRIRADEEIHVRSLRLYLGEIRHLHFEREGGEPVRGAEIVDPAWAGMTRWATVERPRLMAAEERKRMHERILAAEDGERILARFEAIADDAGDAALAGEVA